MIKVVGIRFRNAGKIYYFDPLDIDFSTGDHAIVETARGIEYGTVMIAPREVEDDKVIQPLKPVIRRATPQDDQTVIDNREKEKHAYKVCMEKIAKHELQMKLVQAEYTFDNNKLLFYFTADGRIDFRELVKDLASVFRTRIELRQIGVRDETKMLGGIGICGRELCCCTYLSDFVPVSIKMAKEQNLSLNPTKISGVCGRLMCCLKYEQDTYEYLNSRMPSVGEKVKTPEGIIGEVKSVSVLRQLVRVVIDNGEEKELREYTVDDLRLKPRQKKDVKLTEEELRELKGLEDSGDETMEDEPQEKPQRNRGRRDNRDYRENRDNRENRDSRDNKNEYREHRDKRDNRERRPYRADIEAAEASANETNEVNAANAGRENKDGCKKPYKGGKNRPNKQKHNRNKDYKNKNYNKEYSKDYNRDKDHGSTDTQ